LRFVDEAYKHGKAIAASAEGVDLVKEGKTGKLVTDENATEQGVLYASDAKKLAAAFIKAIANHRFHDRQVDKIMA
jgi:catalase